MRFTSANLRGGFGDVRQVIQALKRSDQPCGEADRGLISFFLDGGATIEPSRIAFFRASLRIRRTASDFLLAASSEGFS